MIFAKFLHLFEYFGIPEAKIPVDVPISTIGFPEKEQLLVTKGVASNGTDTNRISELDEIFIRLDFSMENR